MRHTIRLLLPLALALLAQPAFAAASPAVTRGIVVQRDSRAGALVLATPTGALHRVKTASPGRFSMGAVVRVRGSKISVLGRSHTARVRGVVVRRTGSSFALAGSGTVLSIGATAPPAAGAQVTANVQIGQTALSDDEDTVQVDATQAPSAELRGTVLAQTGTTLTLGVAGFPAGLTLQLGRLTVPALATGTLVEAHVSLGPDPANPSGIVLTLVSLHVEDAPGASQTPGPTTGAMIHAEGTVTALTEAGPAGGAAGSITIADEHGPVTLAIPAGFGPTGALVGDRVEARGAAGAAGTVPVLVRLETSGQGNGNGGGEQGDRGHDGGSSSGSDSSGSGSGSSHGGGSDD